MLIQTLTTKRYDLEGFVVYAKSLCESQAFHAREASNTQRVVDIHTALRKHSVSISAEARDTLQRMQRVWGEFEASLVEGEEFVRKQTPIKAQGLQDSISVCFHQELSFIGNYEIFAGSGGAIGTVAGVSEWWGVH